MDLLVELPLSYAAERDYILSVLLQEFLGLKICIQRTGRSNVRISARDSKALIVDDGLFSLPEALWLKPRSLPKRPLRTWDLASAPLKIAPSRSRVALIYSCAPDAPGFLQISPERIKLGLDIFGSCFFMLTRYEEVVNQTRDRHDRFPATASLAFQEGFLNRPIVNEYVEILWACLKHLWPGLVRKPRKFRVYVSHDVDVPFEHAFAGPVRLCKLCAADIIRRGDPLSAWRRVGNWLRVKNGDARADPCNNVDMIMDLSEKHNLKSAFYFIADRTAGQIDGLYQLTHPWVREMLRRVHKRQHEIGLHASYNTYRDSRQTSKEFALLKKICEEAGVFQECWGGRQHVLRWETPTTFQNWNDAGLDYDSTLTFADVAGFRCGTCYEYPAFNVITRQQLRLVERPLVVMDVTIREPRYMGLGLSEDALRTIIRLKDACRQFDGDFRLLWHNNYLVRDEEVLFYRRVLEG